MKANLKKALGLAALGMTLLANTVPTWAGYVDYRGVIIEPKTSYPNETEAFGSMVGTRDSADNKQYIGCSLDAAPFVTCSAVDSTGKFAGCISYDAGHIDAVQKMTDSSFIAFRFNRANATCVKVEINNNSFGLR
ncbi:MAG: hypothetical protein FJ147_17175 [Deltaproteobacteria bacterium]|nr:hypothetical protein [Deltaproteobacteria bacterium]